MFRTDKAWREWSEIDPYFAVLTTGKYREGQNRSDFFRTGETYFEGLLQDFSRLNMPLNQNATALDYGCGVGRVIKPMSSFFSKTTGVDIAPKMLAIAQKNSPKSEFILMGDSFGQTFGDRKFDFIHSTLVFQHIQSKRGLEILKNLFSALSQDGKMMIQLPVLPLRRTRYLLNQFRYLNPLLFKMSRFLLGRKDWKLAPPMEMNCYSIRDIEAAAFQCGVEVRKIELTIDPERYLVLGQWYFVKAG